MKILIVSATKQESVTLQNTNIDLLVTGVGIPNTILNLTTHLCDNKYQLIINIGVCGSFNQNNSIGNVVEVISDQFSEIGYEENETFSRFNNSFAPKTIFKVSPQTKLESVNGITVNTVHGNKESINKVINMFNPDVESMEGAAFFMVCKSFNTSCIQIRSISNMIEERNQDNWDLPLAINNLHIALQKIISKT